MTEVEVVKEEATETVDQEKEIMPEEREGASLVEVKDILLETVERIKDAIPEIEEEKGVEAENQPELGFPSALLLATPHHGPRARSKKIEMIDMKELLTESTKACCPPPLSSPSYPWPPLHAGQRSQGSFERKGSSVRFPM